MLKYLKILKGVVIPIQIKVNTFYLKLFNNDAVKFSNSRLNKLRPGDDIPCLPHEQNN